MTVTSVAKSLDEEEPDGWVIKTSRAKTRPTSGARNQTRDNFLGLDWGAMGTRVQ